MSKSKVLPDRKKRIYKPQKYKDRPKVVTKEK